MCFTTFFFEHFKQRLALRSGEKNVALHDEQVLRNFIPLITVFVVYCQAAQTASSELSLFALCRHQIRLVFSEIGASEQQVWPVTSRLSRARLT
jgi:hypothetical protein